LGSIADDWKKSLQDTKDVDAMIAESSTEAVPARVIRGA
jgi:hypothetical protein